MKVEILALLIILCVSDRTISFTTASVQSASNDQIFTSYSRRLEGDDDDTDPEDDAAKKPVNPKPLPKKAPAAAPVKKSEDGDDVADEDKDKEEGNPADPAEVKTEEEEKEEESDEDKQAKLQSQLDDINTKTKKAFESNFDNSEDFQFDYMKDYQSGKFEDTFTEDQKELTFKTLQQSGSIIELLEPKARHYNNIPQALAKNTRIDCSPNDGSYKAHFLTVQSSKNYFEWRTKRSSKTGNCTMRVSLDGESYSPLMPMGHTNFKFPCGRKAGYESVLFQLPKTIVSDRGAVMQFEFETEKGVIVQCADIIVQRYHAFTNVKCDPTCSNGGVCQNGVCKCGKMYEGDNCEIKLDADGSYSIILYIFIVAMFVAGILLLLQRDKFRAQIKQYQQERMNRQQQDQYGDPNQNFDDQQQNQNYGGDDQQYHDDDGGQYNNGNEGH